MDLTFLVWGWRFLRSLYTYPILMVDVMDVIGGTAASSWGGAKAAAGYFDAKV